jgi:hypothetical protein
MKPVNRNIGIFTYQYLLNQSNKNEVKMLRINNPFIRNSKAYARNVNGTCSPPDLPIDKMGIPIIQMSIINEIQTK